jgi:hypothetical protein
VGLTYSTVKRKETTFVYMTKLWKTIFITDKNVLKTKKFAVDPSDAEIHSVVQGDIKSNEHKKKL